jgi:hypothetical protein
VKEHNVVEEKWSPFWEAVEIRIEPVLEQAGFIRYEAGFSEEKPGEHPGFLYERATDGIRAGVDALERVQYRDGRDHRFKWIRVRVGGHALRHIFPPSSFSSFYEQDGWVYVNQDQFDQCIDEIVMLLKRHFNIPET